MHFQEQGAQFAQNADAGGLVVDESAGTPVPGRLNTAVADAWAAPRLTSPESARAPSARPKASRTMDLPAPVSPVSAVSPALTDKSSAWIRTTSRMLRPINMVRDLAGRPPSGTTYRQAVSTA
jgi:hypothetical protein